MRDRIYQILQDRPHTVAEIAAILGKPPRSVRTCLAEMVATRSAMRLDDRGTLYGRDVYPPKPPPDRKPAVEPAAKRARLLLSERRMSGPQLRAALGLDDLRFLRMITQEVQAGRIVRIPKPAPFAAWYALPDGD